MFHGFFPPGASWPVSRSKQPNSIKSSSKLVSAGQAGGALAGHRLVMFGLQGSTWHSHGTEVAGSGYSEHKELETSAPSKMRRHFTSRTCTAPRRFDFGPEVQTSQISIHCTTGSIYTVIIIQLCRFYSYTVIQHIWTWISAYSYGPIFDSERSAVSPCVFGCEFEQKQNNDVDNGWTLCRNKKIT